MDEERYSFTNGWKMRREGGHHWYLRDGAGGLVDHDQYRHDLIERYRLTVATPSKEERDDR